MFSKFTKTAPVEQKTAARQAHAEAVAGAERAAEEVARLAALVASSRQALAHAEAAAVDAVAVPESNVAGDSEVMHAVAVARARLAASITAHTRAVATETSARAALPALERQVHRQAAVDELEALTPVLAQIDSAIDVLSDAWPAAEERYRRAMNALISSAETEVAGMAVRPTMIPLSIAEHMRSRLFFVAERDVFSPLGPSTPVNMTIRAKTITDRFLEGVAAMRQRTADEA